MVSSHPILPVNIRKKRWEISKSPLTGRQAYLDMWEYQNFDVGPVGTGDGGSDRIEKFEDCDELTQLLKWI